MSFFVIKKGLVLLEWKYFPTPKILDPKKLNHQLDYPLNQRVDGSVYFFTIP